MNRKLIDQYEADGDIPAKAIQGLSPAELNAVPIPGKWSVQQVIIHLLDSDLVGTDRMKRVIAEDKPTLLAYNETLFFLPPRRSVAALNRGFLQHPQMQEMTKILDQYGGPTALGPDFQRTGQITAPMFADAINKKRSVKEVLDEAAAQANALYREIGFAK